MILKDHDLFFFRQEASESSWVRSEYVRSIVFFFIQASLKLHFTVFIGGGIMGLHKRIIF